MPKKPGKPGFLSSFAIIRKNVKRLAVSTFAVAPYLQIPEDINIHFIENYYASNVYQKRRRRYHDTGPFLLGEKCGNRLKTIDELATESVHRLA